MHSIGSFTSCAENLTEVLDRAAAASNQRRELGITLLDNRGRESDFLGYDAFARSVRQGAGRWRTLGLGPGERVLICLPTSWEFFDAWLGCVLVGALPVALAPPGALGSPTAQVKKALQICSSIDAAWLIAPKMLVDEAQRLAEEDSSNRVGARVIDVADWSRTTPTDGTDVRAEPGETAFLQLTSGSTGLPRAVEISHEAIVHNAMAIHYAVAAIDGAPCDHLVSWLPLYHDMGLIGCFFNSLINHTPLDLLTPRSFLARPWIWLEATSRRTNVMSPAPNFAYQLCVERVSADRAKALDLRPFRHILSGSEMVRPETVEAFLEHFAPAQVDPTRFRASYGLAEATLGVSIESSGRGVHTQTVADVDTVALGSPMTDVEVRVVDPASTGAPDWSNLEALPDGQVGAVMMRSPALMTGYFRDLEATNEVMRNGWLDTGDLGLVHDGETYLTGRRKEILILNGVNVMPHEIEWVAEGVSAAGGSERCGAFSVLDEQGERPVLVMETTLKDHEALQDLHRRVDSAVGRALSHPLSELIFVRRGSIPRTSSGKVQRRALREDYAAARLDRVEFEPDADAATSS